MKTEKRAAKVGERIITVVDDSIFGEFKKGEIHKVAKVGSLSPKYPGRVTSETLGWGNTRCMIDEDEYEVIIDE